MKNLIDNKYFIDMEKLGVIPGENIEAQIFSENINRAQKLNRLYLLMPVTKAELVSISMNTGIFHREIATPYIGKEKM